MRLTGKNYKNFARVALLASCVVVLAACQQKKEAGPPILNGNWASSDGVYTAEFRNGNFQAIATDTGGVISRGEYVALASDRVRLRWVGLVSGQANQAECNKPEPNRMDCVDATGNRFSLTRSL